MAQNLLYQTLGNLKELEYKMFKKGMFIVFLAVVMSPISQASYILASDGTTVNDLDIVDEVVLDVSSTGKLLGAFNVTALNDVYDVWFSNEAFESFFGSVSNVVAEDETEAELLGQALNNQVFLDVGGFYFDSDPRTTQGCGLQSLPDCWIRIPQLYGVMRTPGMTSDLDRRYEYSVYVNDPNESSERWFDASGQGQYSTTLSDDVTFAKFVLSSSRNAVNNVPSPSVSFLFCLAFLIAGFRKFNR